VWWTDRDRVRVRYGRATTDRSVRPAGTCRVGVGRRTETGKRGKRVNPYPLPQPKPNFTGTPGFPGVNGV